MKRRIKEEFRLLFHEKKLYGFSIGLAILGIAIYFVSVTKTNQGMDYVQMSWQIRFLEIIQNQWFLMAVPIVSSIVFSERLMLEYKSGYYMISMSRGTRSAYLLTKVGTVFGAGAIVVLLSELFILIFMLFHSWRPVGGQAPALFYIIAVVLISWCNGGIWALIGMICTILLESRYFSYTTPFLIYFFLQNLQERYFTSVFVLSLNHWIRGKVIGVGASVLFFGIATVLLAVGAYALAKRKVKNA